jgi:arylsulfatase A-like enzyme
MIGEVGDRIGERLLHVFFARRMVDEFEELTHEKKKYFAASADDLRLKALYEFIETASEPFLVHVHFMGTHGPKFEIAAPHFSKGQEQTDKWMEDFYDDSILQFDGYLEEMFRRLEENGKLENSIIVINTDHAKGPGHSRTHARLPLMMFFPNQEPNGRVKSNVQLIDVAPTILDYLGVDKPDWIEGDSVLREEPDRFRRIVSVYALREVGRQIYQMQVVVCDRVYTMWFPEQGVGFRSVAGHTDRCSHAELPSEDEIQQFVFEHLQSRRFDLSRDVRQAE